MALESVNRSEVGKVRLLVGISVIMAEVGSASESSLLGHHCVDAAAVRLEYLCCDVGLNSQ